MTDSEHLAGGAVRPTDPEAPRGRWSGRTVPAIGLLPIRLFLGVTYLYAGIDKFASQHFLSADDPMNVAAQMHGYANFSPLAPLVNAAMPMAVTIGALIALAELAIGLGLITGLAFRLSAGAGAGLSLLFWLTASWSSTPYFFSPDLPYAFGFLTLALVGHGGLSVLSPFERGPVGGAGAVEADPAGEAAGADAGSPGAAATPGSSGRRAVLQVGLLAILTFAVAALAIPLRALGYGGRPAGTAVTPTKAPATAAPSAPPTPAPTEVAPIASASATPTAATAAPTAAPTSSPTPPPTAPPTATPGSAAGSVMGNLTDFANGANGLAITMPMDAPFAAGPGGPGIMVRLPDGSVAAYSAICTHGRCIVGWDASTNIIQCPCHTARFDPAAHAAVLSGPAPFPLPEVPVVIGPDGVIHMGAIS